MLAERRLERLKEHEVAMAEFKKEREREKEAEKGRGDRRDDGGASSKVLEENRSLRRILYCSVTPGKMKNTVLTSCYHCFSRETVDTLIKTRNRKCPICGRPFGPSDFHDIFIA